MRRRGLGRSSSRWNVLDGKSCPSLRSSLLVSVRLLMEDLLSVELGVVELLGRHGSSVGIERHPSLRRRGLLRVLEEALLRRDGLPWGVWELLSDLRRDVGLTWLRIPGRILLVRRLVHRLDPGRGRRRRDDPRVQAVPGDEELEGLVEVEVARRPGSVQDLDGEARGDHSDELLEFGIGRLKEG